MAATLGTYSAGISPYTPTNILPRSGDVITLDWMDACSQFSQRFIKMATVIATVALGGSYGFDYSSLKCDENFPILCSYYWDTVDSGWSPITGLYGTNWTRWHDISLVSATFVNQAGSSRAFLMTAYL